MSFTYSPMLADVLENARLAYRRRDDDAFAGLLEEAIKHAPQRLDLRFCLANKHVQTDRPDLARGIFEEMHRLVPDDVDTLFCLAHWLRYLGESADAEALRWRLAELRPQRAVDLGRIWECCDAWAARPIRGFVAEPEGESIPRIGVVVLGHKLTIEGAATPVLVARLEKGLEVFEAHAGSFIVVSGGLPQAGRVEAMVMREWLERRGVDGGRIYEEGYARDTVENLIYSRYIVDMVGVDVVVLVTSAYNIRRAGVSMEVLGEISGAGWRVEAVSSEDAGFKDFVDNGNDRLKVYRDVLRAYGVPMMAAYPQLAER